MWTTLWHGNWTLSSLLINELLKTKIKAPSHNTKIIQIIIKKNKPFCFGHYTKLTKKYSILLNRAPT
jgi:hypothetical protein